MIDYQYNIWGWMTHINKDQMLLPDPALFSGKDVLPKYKGNIAEVDWRAVETIGQNTR